MRRMTRGELSSAFSSLELEAWDACRIFDGVAAFCCKVEDRGDLAQLERVTFEFADLAVLARDVGLHNRNFNEDFGAHLDQLVALGTVRKLLRRPAATVQLNGELVASVSVQPGIRANLVLAFQRAGFSIADLQVVIEVWNSKDIEVDTSSGVVEVATLMAAARDDGWIE